MWWHCSSTIITMPPDQSRPCIGICSKVLQIASDMHHPKRIRMSLAPRQVPARRLTGKVIVFRVMHVRRFLQYVPPGGRRRGGGGGGAHCMLVSFTWEQASGVNRTTLRVHGKKPDAIKSLNAGVQKLQPWLTCTPYACLHCEACCMYLDTLETVI